MPRFIKEYANHQKKAIARNPLMKQEIKDCSIKQIEKAVLMCERGFITIDEAMRIINKPFED